MFDIRHPEKYKESNRLEAKRSLGGLPLSLWETYSAFANTHGGVILLGVEEAKDKSLHAIDLPDRNGLIEEFWETINTPSKVSVNILSARNIEQAEADGKRILVITVPKAERFDKPVYIGEDPFTGSYRRNGDGDYRCTREEVESMLRDASQKSQDMRVLEDMEPSVLDRESIRSYRRRMLYCRPGHVLGEADTEEFLYKLGATGRGGDGKMHPTLAGLVMFGYASEIVKACPDFALDYKERPQENDRITAAEESWDGNIYNFYFRVYEKLTRDICVQGGDDAAIRKSLGEALANCLINADYYGKGGIAVCKDGEKIAFSNPGRFRIDIEAAKSGGVSDPRNSTLIKMFHLIDIGNGSGSGIPDIFRVWTNHGWKKPQIYEATEPDRVTMTLYVA